MIQFAKHRAAWNVTGIAIIVLITTLFVVKLVHDARQQPKAVRIITIEK